MKDFTLLTKSETREYHENGESTHYINVFMEVRKSSDQRDQLYLDLGQWQRRFTTTEEGRNYLREKLGKPTLHRNYEYREMMWGYEYRGVKLILFYSIKGFSLEIEESCPGPLFREITDKIIDYLS